MKKEKRIILHELDIELVKLQKEIIASGLKLVILLEGRDAAGKDGTVKRITQHLSPRETRVVALGKPSDREIHEWYFQRYVEHLPTSGEMVIFNRSWYNRAGVEKVMHFCSDSQVKSFYTEVKLFEEMLRHAGIRLLKYYLDVSKTEQRKRLNDRKVNPLKQWKVSPVDAEAQKRWKEYSSARNEMLLKTNFAFTPWFVADAEDKNDLHIGLISHLLSQVKYKDKRHKLLRHHDDLIFPVTPDLSETKLYE
jgi:polyphosphate kinase